MCEQWDKLFFDKQLSCSNVKLYSGSGNYVMEGNIQSEVPDPLILFWAPNPPTRNYSVSGSGLPWPNPELAYHNTPNRGAVRAENRRFRFRIHYPNSFYVGLGSVYEKPQVLLKICEPNGTSRIQKIELGHGIPYRTLTYPNQRKNNRFYSRAKVYPEVATQEQILRKKGYNRKHNMHRDFWKQTAPPA